MPLTDKGDKIMGAMKEQYGDKKGEHVFYGAKSKGTIKGVDEGRDAEGKWSSGGEGEGEGEGGEKEGGEKEGIKSGIEETLKTTPIPPPFDLGGLGGLHDDVIAAERAFDEVRDQMHKIDKRIDDCAAPDDRSSEGHAKAAAEAKPGSSLEKFHMGEVGRRD